MSIRTDIAKAVESRLQTAATAGEFGNNIIVRRTYVPIYNLTDATKTYFTVHERSFDLERESRINFNCDVEIGVAVQKKVASEDPEEIDPLGDLVEQVLLGFTDGLLADVPNAVMTKASNRMMYIPQLLKEQRLFTSVITILYRAKTNRQ